MGVPADLVAELVAELLSPKVGVIQSIAPQGRDRGEPRPPYLYTATLAHFDYRQADAAERIGAGKGLTREAAIASAIGEAIERYCAYQGDPARTFVATSDDLGDSAIRPVDLVLYSDEQYERTDWPHPRWSAALPLPWLQAVALPSRQPVAVPAGLTFLAADARPYFAPSTSNGLAAGATQTDAILGALCEVMERDAFLITWMNRLPAVELDLARSGPFAASIRRHYGRRQVDVHAFVLPTDLPATTVLALALDDDPAVPGQVVGLGCHPSPGVALTKALLELAQSRPAEAHRFRTTPPAGRLDRYEDVKTLDDHSAFLSQHDRRPEFEFLFGGAAGAAGAAGTAIADVVDWSTGDAAADVDRCAGALVDAGHRVAYADLTLSDIASVGLSVVRVLVTELQPIHFGYGLERLGGSRLTAAPHEWGLAEAVRTHAQLNRCPHPLA